MYDDADERPSKSARKRHSDELQALGEELIGLSQAELDAIELPETLRDAVLLARRITKHGGLYRQKQYIGKLMRKIDAEPIRAALEARRQRARLEARRFHRIEQWRDQLLRDGQPAIDSFLAESGAALEPAALLKLVQQANEEQRAGAAPRAARELFRVLRDALPDTV